MRHDLFWSSRDHERSTSKFDLRSYHGNDQVGHVAYQSMRLVKANSLAPSHVSISFLSNVMDRKRTLLWHVMTSSGHYTFLPITFDRKELWWLHDCMIFWFFFTDFDASKSALGSFFTFFAKIWPKNMYRSSKSRFFLFDLFHLVTWDDLDLYYCHKAQELILTDVSDTIHADSLALFALNIEILLADVTKPEKPKILTLTWPVTSSVTAGSNFWPCTGSSRTGLSNGVWNLEIGPVVWEISRTCC